MESMIPESFNLPNRFPYSVVVGHEGASVRSRRSVDPYSASFFGSDDATQINDETFMATVVESIKQSNLFKEVKRNGTSDFRLDVSIISEIKPQPGLQMSSTVVSGWRLTRSSDQKIVFDEIIEKTHKATPGSFAGIRTAKEGVVRETIEEAIMRLSHTDLESI